MGAKSATRNTGTRVQGGFGGFGGFMRTPPGWQQIEPDLPARATNTITAPSSISRVPSPDLPPMGDYNAPTNPQPSLTIYPGGGRPSGTTTVPGSRFNNPSTSDPSGAGLAPSGLTGNTLRSFPNERFVSSDMSDSNPGRSPTLITDPNMDWRGMDYRTTGNEFTEIPGSVYDETQYRDSGNTFAELPGSVYDENPANRQQPSVTVDAGANDGPSPGSLSQAGHDIGNFGSNMTIGQFLNTPLSFMHFAENRGTSPAPVGRGTVHYANTSYTSPQVSGDPEIDDATGWSPTREQAANANTTFTEAEARGEQETAAASTGRTVQATTQRPSNSLTTILQTYPSLNNPASIRALQSGANPSQLMGHAQFDSHAAGALEMWYQSMGGNPNNTGATSDEGMNIFQNLSGPIIGHVNDEGALEHIANPAYLKKWQHPRDPRWVFPTDSKSVQSNGGFDAQKYNSWLAAHNQWFYGKG